MEIPRKLYSVTFGEISSKKDMPRSLNYTVMAETAERAFEIVRETFFRKADGKIYYAAEARMLAENIDAD
jgi:hypothetical protein